MSSSEKATPARTLADQLRQWPDDRLADLLRVRPDLATPAPQDSSQLASRAATRSSVHRALDGLNRLELSVLDAHVVAGQTTTSGLVELVHAESAAVEQAERTLIDMALVWQGPGGLRALSGVADVLRTGTGVGVSGVQPRSADPASPEEIKQALEALSEQARTLIGHLDAHGGEGTSGRARRTVTVEDAETPVEELLAHGLLIPREGDVVVLPGEVALVLRGGHTTTDRVDEVPVVAVSAQSADLVESSAGGAAFELCRRAQLLLDIWGLEPPTVLRNGGLSVRDLRSAGRELQTDDPTTAMIIELVFAAGLLAEGDVDDTRRGWLPTHDFDEWVAMNTAQRWYVLASAWLHSHRVPSLVGSRDPSGKAWSALSPELSSAYAVEARHLTLEELAAIDPGQTLAPGTGVPSLVARLGWRRPRRPRVFAGLVADTIDESELIGVTGAGALSGAGRALLQGDKIVAAAALGPHLPTPVDHVFLQADLTAIAPGPLETDLARTLHLMGDIESRGGATVYRFTPDSIRRAMDVGWTAEEIHEFVASASRTEVPQPLTYLIDDVARTFGKIRVGAVAAFLRADEESDLTELLHNPRAAKLGIRRIAPTVLVSTTPVNILLTRLRELGHAPVIESPDGTLHLARPDVHRARRPRPSPPAGATIAREEATVAAVVSKIREGDRAAAARGDNLMIASTPAGALAALREAVETDTVVVLSYVDNHGRASDRVVTPARVEGGRLLGHDHAADSEREFAIHRVTSVRPHDMPPDLLFDEPEEPGGSDQTGDPDHADQLDQSDWVRADP